VIAHVSILALLVLSTEVHPFQAVPSETIAIDLVTPAEVEKKPEPTPTPQIPPPDLSKLAEPATPAAPLRSATPAAPSQQSAAAPSQQRQAARSAPRESAAQPQPKQPPPPAPPTAASSPGYTAPEPDITVKYHVMLGLPEAVPPPTASSPPPSNDKPGDGTDTNASTAADIASSLIAEFRRHLKTCSKLPPEIDRSDEIEIKLRVFMTPQGTLAAEPNPVGIKHPSENGPALLQSAIAALQACQPYSMLPKDRYGEWKVIDLTFTPRDFSGS
jgi:hypothetical protein